MEHVRKICTLCKAERQFEHSTRRDTNCPIPRLSRGQANSRSQKGRKVFTHDTTRTNAPLKKRNTLRKKNTSAAASTQAEASSATRQSTKEDAGATKSTWLRTWLNKLPMTTFPKSPAPPSSATSPLARKAASVDLSRVVPLRRTEEAPTALPTNTTQPPMTNRTRTRTSVPLVIPSSSTPNLSRHFSLSKKLTPRKNTATTTTVTPSTPTKLQKRVPAPPRPKSTATATATATTIKTPTFPPRPTSTVLRPPPPAPDPSPTRKRPQTHNPDLPPDQAKGAVAGDDDDDDDPDGELELSETRRLLWEYWNVQCRFLADEQTAE